MNGMYPTRLKNKVTQKFFEKKQNGIKKAIKFLRIFEKKMYEKLP